jgi:protein O-mannosyl-transferase
MTRRERLARFTAPTVVALITFAAFLPSLQNGFVTWDDDRNFLDNPNYRGLGAEHLHWMWTTFHMGHYVPLSWMTLGLDYELWGMDARGYHLTSLLIHVANAVVLYFVAVRLYRIAFAERSGTSANSLSIAAAFAALVFAVHPLRVESVAWVTERRDVLSGLFVSASLLCYLEYATSARGRRLYWASLLLFVCALLSKATSLTLPAVLLVINVYPLNRLNISTWRDAAARRVIGEVLPYALLAAATIPLTIVALAPPGQLGLGGKIAVSAYSLMFYLWKSILPLGLSPLYAMPPCVNAAELRFIAGYVFVVLAVLGAWVARKRYPGLTTAALVFSIVILPMLGIVQNGPQIAADRYTYHASPALTILLGGALLSLLANSISTALKAGEVVVVLALAALTWRQTEVWHDPKTFWTYVLSTDTTSAVAEVALSDIDLEEKKNDSAIEHLLRAVRYDSTYAEGFNNLGIALSRERRFAEAIPQFQRALTLSPRNRESHNNLGVAEANLGELDAAVAEYQEAIEIDPKYADAEVNWGNALVRAGHPADALPHYAAAVRLRSTNADAHFNWGVALAQTGQMPDAIEQFRAALSIDPDHAEARTYLNQALAVQQAGATTVRRP